jgi:ribosomal protein S12
LFIFIGKEGQTAHVLDGSTAKSFPFSMIQPAAAAQMHADEQAKRLRADGITGMVALRSGTAEYAPLRNRQSNRNYRQGNEKDDVQDNTEEDDVQGNTEEDDVQGNTEEDNAQDIDDKNNSPTALNAILPRMTCSTTRAAVAASGLGIVHHVFAAKAAKPNDAMDREVRVNAINKEVRGLFNRGAFSLLHVDAVPSNIIGTRIITRLKHFGIIDEEAKARLIIQGCQDAVKNRIVSNAPTVSHASIRILISFAANKDYPV